MLWLTGEPIATCHNTGTVTKREHFLKSPCFSRSKYNYYFSLPNYHNDEISDETSNKGEEKDAKKLPNIVLPENCDSIGIPNNLVFGSLNDFQETLSEPSTPFVMVSNYKFSHFYHFNLLYNLKSFKNTYLQKNAISIQK